MRNPVKKVKLLPCPFCGRENPIFNLAVDSIPANSFVWRIYCERCECRGPRTVKSSEKAIQLWNKRFKKPCIKK